MGAYRPVELLMSQIMHLFRGQAKFLHARFQCIT